MLYLLGRVIDSLEFNEIGWYVIGKLVRALIYVVIISITKHYRFILVHSDNQFEYSERKHSIDLYINTVGSILQHYTIYILV